MLLSVFHAKERMIRQHSLDPGVQTPGLTHMGLPVSDFAGGFSHAWTDMRALLALDALAMHFDEAFPVCRAFRPDAPPPFCFGTGFTVGRGLPWKRLEALRRAALNCGLFTRVSPAYDAGDRIELSCCPVPAALSIGSMGPEIFALQNALNAFGCFPGPLTGLFGDKTRRALNAWQRAQNLPRRDVVYVSELSLLLAQAAKIMQTSPCSLFFSLTAPPLAATLSPCKTLRAPFSFSPSARF